MARFLKPLVRSGGYYPSRRWTPLVYPGGYTTANGGVQPEPEVVLKTVTGSLIHITDALALPAKALTVNVEPIQAGTGDPSPDNVRPISGRTSATVTRTGKNLLDLSAFEFNDSTYIHSYDPLGAAKPLVDFLNEHKGQTFILSGTITGTAIGAPIGQIRLYKAGESLITITPGTAFTVASVNFSDTTTVYCYGSTNGASFTDIQLQVGSTATAYSPYVGTTYTIQLGDTVYGGTLDVTGGKMVVTHMLFNRNSATMNNSNAYPGWNDAGLKALGYTGSRSGMNTLLNIGSEFSYNCDGNNDILFFGAGAYHKTQEEWKALALDIQIVIPLVTPIEITLTPTQIDMLLGENNIWSDGEMTLTYLEDGNASDEEALNILLGGRYVNNHSEDEPTDREALDILLGR